MDRRFRALRSEQQSDRSQRIEQNCSLGCENKARRIYPTVHDALIRGFMNIPRGFLRLQVY